MAQAMNFINRSGRLVTHIVGFVPKLFTHSVPQPKLIGASAKRVARLNSPLLAARRDCRGESRLNRSIQEAQ